MKYSKGKVYQYSIDGKFLREFENSMDIEFKLKIPNAQLSSHLSNKSRHCHGFLFSRKYYLKYPIHLLVKKPNKTMLNFEKDFYSYDTNGKFLKKYSNLKEVSERNDIRGWVRACLKGENKTYDDKIWIYEFYEILPEDILNKILNKRIVYIDANGCLVDIYKNISDASRKTGIKKSSIYNVISGKQNRVFGKIFLKYNEYKKYNERKLKKGKAKEKIVANSNKKMKTSKP
jgi:hypothetical protein